MDDFDLPEIKEAISGISKKLNITLDVAFKMDYQNGKYPSLLSYEKVEKPVFEIPIATFNRFYLLAARFHWCHEDTNRIDEESPLSSNHYRKNNYLVPRFHFGFFLQ